MNNLQRKELTEREKQKDFVLAGNATFTVKNTETGGRFTFKVKKHEVKTDQDGKRILHFVKVLTGSDNTNDYTYIGTIYDQERFTLTLNSKVREDAVSYKAFDYIWKCLRGPGLPPKVKFYHEGRCCRCGRALTVPESIEKGIGPECERRS